MLFPSPVHRSKRWPRFLHFSRDWVFLKFYFFYIYITILYKFLQDWKWTCAVLFPQSELKSFQIVIFFNSLHKLSRKIWSFGCQLFLVSILHFWVQSMSYMPLCWGLWFLGCLWFGSMIFLFFSFQTKNFYESFTFYPFSGLVSRMLCVLCFTKCQKLELYMPHIVKEVLNWNYYPLPE